MTSQNDVPYFHMNQQLLSASAVTPTSHFNVVNCDEVVENVHRRTKMKIDSTGTSILRQIDVDLMSVAGKTYCVLKYTSGKIMCALR